MELALVTLIGMMLVFTMTGGEVEISRARLVAKVAAAMSQLEVNDHQRGAQEKLPKSSVQEGGDKGTFVTIV